MEIKAQTNSDEPKEAAMFAAGAFSVAAGIRADILVVRVFGVFCRKIMLDSMEEEIQAHADNTDTPVTFQLTFNRQTAEDHVVLTVYLV